MRDAILRPLVVAAALWLWLGAAVALADDERAVTPVFWLLFLLPPAAVAATATGRAWREGRGHARVVLAVTSVAVGLVLALCTLVLWFRTAEHLCGGRYECPF